MAFSVAESPTTKESRDASSCWSCCWSKSRGILILLPHCVTSLSSGPSLLEASPRPLPRGTGTCSGMQLPSPNVSCWPHVFHWQSFPINVKHWNLGSDPTVQPQARDISGGTSKYQVSDAVVKLRTASYLKLRPKASTLYTFVNTRSWLDPLTVHFFSYFGWTISWTIWDG